MAVYAQLITFLDAEIAWWVTKMQIWWEKTCLSYIVFTTNVDHPGPKRNQGISRHGRDPKTSVEFQIDMKM